MERSSSPLVVRVAAVVLLAAPAAALLAVSRALPPADLGALGLDWVVSGLAATLLAVAAATVVAALVEMLRSGGVAAAGMAGSAAALTGAAACVLVGARIELPVAGAATLLLIGAIGARAGGVITGRRGRLAAAIGVVGASEALALAELLPPLARAIDPFRAELGWATAALAAAAVITLAGRAGAFAALGLGTAGAALGLSRGAGAELAVGLAALVGAQVVGLVMAWPQPHREPDTIDERLPQLAGRVSDAVLSFDGHLRLRDWNARAARLLGLDAGSGGTRIEDLLGIALTELPMGDGPTALSSRVGGLAIDLARDGSGIVAVIHDPAPTPGAERLARELRGTIEELLQARRTIELQRQEIERASTIDPLTGVESRAAILERLRIEVAQARRYAHPVAIVLLDVDRFAAINRAHGTAAGDAALRELALRLRLRIREADAIGRAGSDSFVAVLPHTDEAGAASFADALRRRVSQRPIAVGDSEARVTLSVGVAVMRSGEQIDVDALLVRVEEALASARSAGGDRIALDRLHGLARLEEHRPEPDPGRAQDRDQA